MGYRSKSCKKAKLTNPVLRTKTHAAHQRNGPLKRMQATVELDYVKQLREQGFKQKHRKRINLLGNENIRLLQRPRCPRRTSTRNTDEVQSVVKEYSELFTGDEDPFGFCPWIEQEIPLSSERFRPYGPRPLPRRLREEWFDVMGPFPVTTSENQFIVIMTEHLSRWVEEAAVPNERATTISGVVMNHIVANHRVLRMILTDQGPCFESEKFRNCFQKLGIREWLAAKGGDWILDFPMVLLAHRASIQPTTGKSPFMLMHVRHPRLPVDQEVGLWPTTCLSPEELDEETRKARENLTTIQKRTRQKTASRKARSFPMGAKVKWKDHQNPGRSGLGSRKLGSRWQGPFVVTVRRGERLYNSRRSGITKSKKEAAS
ncbi:hypothetical protein CLF_102622 [Clonorchis sinensis]|uniref:Integrase catalytic domain-containing protein n=1 Tax=Clonorchis sinensis TaxID=79923 RepID=G7Y888_CLOSI|nr:hypothetical protein CLF_102622 [Clonorchis sinensis]